MEDRDDKTGKSGSERDGVRLVRKDEAEAAIKSGEAVGRRKASQPPIDLSESSGRQSSARPVPRFPASSPNTARGSQIRPTLVARPTPIVIEDGDESTLDLRSSVRNDDDIPEEADQPARRSPEADDPLPETGALPHWTEPATGDVPMAFMDVAVEGQTVGAFPRWRDPNRRDDVEPMSFDDLREASGLGTGTGAEFAIDVAVDADDKSASGSPGAETAAEAPKGGSRFRSPSATESAKSKLSALGPASLGPRVATAVIFAAAALGAFALGPAWTLTLATAVMLMAAVELFDGFRRRGYRPATVLALLGVAGTMLGSYARGPEAMPLLLTLMLVFTFLWYMTGVIKESPTSNAAVTILGFVWTGVLGSYAAIMLRLPARHGMALLIGAVIVTIAYDTTAYLGGSVFGKHPLSRAISPNKTWEGLAAGTIGAIVAGGVIVSLIHPWNFGRALLLGVVISVVAPLGDLAESMIKRDLGLKDMGRLLPGHGGVMDRFDALLFVLPATYYLARMLNLA